jgi:hypothetical protein
MIKIYGDCSESVIEAANAKLSNFIDIFHSLIFDYPNDDNQIQILETLFPTLLVEEKTDKCLKAIKDLYNWSNDRFTHTLRPIHEYALYQILHYHEEQFRTEEENYYNMTEYKLYDEEDIDIDIDIDDKLKDYTINDTNTFYFYYCNCFLDFDFYFLNDYLKDFEENGIGVFEGRGIDIKEYEDLIPLDIIEVNHDLKRLLESGPVTPKALVGLDEEQFFYHIQKLMNDFNHSIVNHSLYKLLWNDDGTPRKEKTAQDLLLNNIYIYCNNNGIDVSKEPNIGRGPVDFKLSSGTLKVLIEVKLASNSAFWHGLEVQTIQYMVSENINHAIFLVIIHYKEEFEKIKEIEMLIGSLKSKYSIELSAHIVDATKDKPSASKTHEDLLKMFKKVGD